MLKKLMCLGIVGLVLYGCSEDNRSPKEKMREQMKSTLKVMVPIMASEVHIPSTNDLIDCMADTIVDTFTDEEARLITDSTFSERIERGDEMMRIQQRFESPQMNMKIMMQCYNEIERVQQTKRR